MSSAKSADEVLKQLREHMTRTIDFFKFKGVTEEFNKLGDEMKERKLSDSDNPLKGIHDQIKLATGKTYTDKPWYQNMTKKIIQFVIAGQKPVTKEEKAEERDYYDSLKQKIGEVIPSFSEQISEAQKNIKVGTEEVKAAQVAIYEKFHYDEEGSTIVSDEVLEDGLGVNDGNELCFKETTDNAIDLDNKEIDEMVLSAKMGNFDRVFSILDRKPYIVNCIPEERAWSALHQAIFLGNLEYVVKLVEDYGADVSICTKADRAAAADPGTDALSLALKFSRKHIYNFLLKYTLIHKTALKRQDISYFTLHKNGNVYPFYKYPLFKITLASYKTLFMKHNSLIDSKKHIVHIVEDVLTNTDISWKDAMTKVHSTLYGIDRSYSEYLLNAYSREDFFERIIRMHTEEILYHFVTPALIRQSHTPYKPLAADLAVGPFALMLSAVLLHWERLKPYSGCTYRGVGGDVTDKYKPGQTFLFLYFVASSQNRRVAEFFAGEGDETVLGTIFIFDNSTPTKWQPRSIRKYSKFPDEEECLFPLGAEFRVESVNKKSHEIHLKLLQPTN
ncbi:hypothetical protein KUTeg_024727 [Tegillarca granosa]|uniref:NAD(P)(+)--arginine ADP-ribosyltransferase n=1 Tax=Tegillarca granosa TaxID=220873 RepID=A0ABQ9E3A6_TEGGR|nr:hypothetical protein KUTeg_024727 [Tegillarca granosa]